MTKIIRATEGGKHHFFGFHDLPAWNFNGNKLLSLEVDTISRPPLPFEMAGVGYVDREYRYHRIGETCAYNYPQGSRMQWVGKSELFMTNNVNGNKWGCDLYDTSSNKLIDKYPFSCHCLHQDGKTVFSINYARLFRLGMYGYSGLEDHTRISAIPKNDGIMLGNLETKEERLLISTEDVANFPDKLLKEPFGHHYLTHLVLNPSHTRIAFLHRYPLADGGEITRLMTIGIDGENLRCLASGFLSHFDWKDDETIFIFGRTNSNLDALRSNPILALPGISLLAKLGKSVIRTFMKTGTIASSNFLLITDNSEPVIKKVAENVITEDGHPMFCPTNRDWIINDNYPNADGIRTLFLYQFSTNQRTNLGTFKMTGDKLNMELRDKFFEGVENSRIAEIGESNLAFTRSGLHCDLHPRWDMKGEKVAFDSIHEGTRQLYVADVRDIVQ